MIKEGISFGDFDSIEEGLVLTYREDTPPVEKEIKEPLPFVQGDYDFSRILGEPIRENRTPRYEFLIKENDYDRRKIIEVKYENMLLNQGHGRIYDTANPGYYYIGKCIDTDVVLDDTWQQLKLVVTFDCYPYMISEMPEGHDIWDDFNFELDIAQKTKFEVNGEQEIMLYNPGATSVVPTITADADFTIKKGTLTLEVPTGTHESELLRIDMGENQLTVIGDGSIEFDFYKELI